MCARPTNWAGNVTYGVDRVHRPATIEQLRQILAHGQTCRILGSGHSFNQIADTDGELISLDALPPRIDIDTVTNSVSVNAATRYGELVKHLHKAGYALHNLGSLPHISVGGSCATATHGSGVSNGNLATAVSAVELVTADGGVVNIDRNDDAFPGAVVALGTLGAVTTLTLDLEPTFEVEQYVYDNLPFDALDEHLDTILAAAYSVSLFTRWRERHIDQVWIKHRTDHPTWTGGDDWFGATLATGPRHPVPGMPADHCTEQLGRRGPWHERLAHFRLEFTPSSGAELQSEYFVSRNYARQALDALDDLRQLIAPVLQVSEIRTVAADDLWLSPAYQRDLVGFHFTWTDDMAGVLKVLPHVEQVLDTFGAVPHWGKVFTMDPETVQARYPRLNDFRKLARTYDPAGAFRNDFVDRYLFG